MPARNDADEDQWGALVASVIDEALRTFEDRKEFSRTITAVKQRVAELEGQLKTGNAR